MFGSWQVLQQKEKNTSTKQNTINCKITNYQNCYRK